jgi:hypothetical protein
VPLEPFPSVPFGEFTVTRPFTAPGLFFYRHVQATNLLHFPDLTTGDMSREQHKDALLRMVNAHRPLAALVLFLGVVALEDFIRDLGARLSDIDGLNVSFPAISELRPTPTNQQRPYARPDRDPAALSNWPAVNDLYARVLAINPFSQSDLRQLHDLAIIRHTVAHHAALIRAIDVPRFQFWSMQANAQINPPVEFVQSTSHFLYVTGRTFETTVAERVISVVLQQAEPDWFNHPSRLLLSLIETFNWFGKLPTEDGITPVYGTPDYAEQVRIAHAANRDQVTQLCLEELRLRRAALFNR